MIDRLIEALIAAIMVVGCAPPVEAVCTTDSDCEAKFPGSTV
jgi:hypothetical protein